MANTVYLVDDTTRLILPASQWAFNVREKLSHMGHKVVSTTQDPFQVEQNRPADEVARVDQLLDSTGL